MPTRHDDFDGLDPAEYPEPDSDDLGQMPCPACGHPIYDDSVRCPVCATYLTETRRKSAWILLGALICLALSLGWVIYG